MNNGVEERLQEFKEDLKSDLSSIQIVRKHIISGDCVILSPDKYFDLRSEVAEHFGLHPNEVFVVGSAKLGFSVAPNNRYREFCDESDIDIAMVSSMLFEQFWQEVFNYRYEGPYWPEYSQFIHYLFQGWIRPDMLPRSSMFRLRERWWNFFQSVTRSRRYGDYKIRGGLYRSYFFLENYQKISIQECINNLEENNARSIK